MKSPSSGYKMEWVSNWDMEVNNINETDDSRVFYENERQEQTVDASKS